MPTKQPAITIILNDQLYKRLEDYRFNHRFKTMSEAVRTLLEKGLASETKKRPAVSSKAGNKPS